MSVVSIDLSDIDNEFVRSEGVSNASTLVSFGQTFESSSEEDEERVQGKALLSGAGFPLQCRLVHLKWRSLLEGVQ
jgi:hypothetical protein